MKTLPTEETEKENLKYRNSRFELGRQASITTELTEIISGAESIKKILITKNK